MKRERVLLLAPSTRARPRCQDHQRVCPKYFPGTLSGTVHLFTDWSTIEPWHLLTEVGMSLQNPVRAVHRHHRRGGDRLPLESLGLPRAEMSRRIEASLSLGLTHLRDANEGELSGGERKRVLLAIQEAVHHDSGSMSRSTTSI